MRSWLLFAVAAAAAVNSCGCNPGKKPTRFAIVSNNAEEWWTTAERGAEKASKDFNVEVIFRKPPKGTVAEQKEIIDALVNKGIDGIAISVLEPVNQNPDLKQIAKKTKFIAMDNDAPGSDRLCYVGTDNVGAGRSAGRLVTRALPQGGTVAIFVGNTSSLNAQERYKGVTEFLQESEKAKGVKYVIHKNSAITDGADRTQALNNAKDVLDQIGSQPNVCLVGLYAYNPPMILEAAKNKGLVKKVKIVAFDEDNATLKGIEEGDIEGTVVQDPFLFAYMSVEILAAEVAGDTSKRAKNAVPHRVITKDGKAPDDEKSKTMTPAEFKSDLDDKLGKK